ncbi:MAG: chemotaxis protein CheD [Leptospirales bacterium]|nr:chemotaxis protein CheD [Leptospirales bacterium]
METLKLIHVGIAEMRITSGENTLRTILGSCIGICLYDQSIKMGGLAHIMLPSANAEDALAEKYADTALPLMVRRMEDAGSDPKRIKAKIAGGARMFDLPGNSMIASIGINNANKVQEILSEMGIKLIGKDIGGNYSRTITFHSSTGAVKVKATGMPDMTL